MLSPGEFASGALCPGLGSPVRETHTGVSPVQRQGGEGAEASYTQGEAGKAGTIQPAKEGAWKALTHVHNECLMVEEVKMLEADSFHWCSVWK